MCEEYKGFEIGKLNLQSGDILVFKATEYLPKSEIEHIKAKMAVNFPDIKILVLDGGLDLAVLIPDEDTSQAA